jgi:hypothetical protein
VPAVSKVLEIDGSLGALTSLIVQFGLFAVTVWVAVAESNSKRTVSPL